MVMAGYVLFYLFPVTLAGLIAGIVVMDLGLQGIHVSNQSRIYALLPDARNRLNTVFMTISFIGTSLGSALGLFMWSLGGWGYVTLAGVGCMIAAFAIYAMTYKRR
jgi:predicted MFS family arabinose efflux permease